MARSYAKASKQKADGVVPFIKNKKCEEDEIKSIIGGTKPLKYKYIPGFPFVVEDKFDEFLKIIKDADPRDPGLFTINSIA